MIDKKVFEKSMLALLYFKGVKNDQHHTDFLYNLMKDDFSDKEFQEMCGDICKTEDLFGKYPDPKIFYDRKKTACENILIEEGAFFIDDTMPQYKAVLEDLSQEKRDDVCLNVWNWLIKNRRGDMVSEQFIIDRLKQFRPQYQEDFLISPSLGQRLLGVIKKI